CAQPLSLLERRVECPACRFVHYANPIPAVAALVLDENERLLLARRAQEPFAGRWDMPGGFLEEGERPVEALRRELEEETSLTVAVGRLVGVYPDAYGEGPDAVEVVNLAWEAIPVAGDPAPADDVSELRWFSLDELPPRDELAFGWIAPMLEEWVAARRGRSS
ncbi:MAG: NUDIX domain-containing protein, partial [Thermoleophilia bacterium]|nr:NUDIX domain-containing protein [Thermoleophilia bacterium]